MKANNETPEQGQNVATDNKRIVIVKAGNLFPTIEDQIRSSKTTIQNIKDDMAREVEELFGFGGTEIMELAINSIHTNLVNEKSLFLESDKEISEKAFNEMVDNTYTLTRIVLMLLRLSNDRDDMRHYEERIELAEHGVLL